MVVSHLGAIIDVKLHKSKATVVSQPDPILVVSDGFWLKRKATLDQKCHYGT